MLLDDGSGATIEVTCKRPPARATENSLKDAPTTADGSLIANKADVGGGISRVGISDTGGTIDFSKVDIGSVVKVKGGIGEWRGEKKITLERLCMVDPPRGCYIFK